MALYDTEGMLMPFVHTLHCRKEPQILFEDPCSEAELCIADRSVDLQWEEPALQEKTLILVAIAVQPDQLKG